MFYSGLLGQLYYYNVCGGSREADGARPHTPILLLSFFFPSPFLRGYLYVGPPPWKSWIFPWMSHLQVRYYRETLCDTLAQSAEDSPSKQGFKPVPHGWKAVLLASTPWGALHYLKVVGNFPWLSPPPFFVSSYPIGSLFYAQPDLIDPLFLPKKSVCLYHISF